ncbi:MAG: hypothetical protein AAGF78_11425 [Pseudomonadota bacterium]
MSRSLASVLAVMMWAAINVAPAQASETNDFWVVWERHLSAMPGCDGEDCSHSLYFGHYIDGLDGPEAQRFFNGLAPFASAPENTAIRMGRSPICLEPPKPGLPDVTTLEIAEKSELLRDLPGVHVDLRGVRGPQSFRGSFGEQAQAFLEASFAAHDIPILTKEQAAATRANPVLKMRYSPEVHGCRPWSVSLSLSQRMLLAHNVTLLLEGGTWSGSARQDEANADFDEAQAMEKVILDFVAAWRAVNDPSWTAEEETN